jgi:hypothetical protein
MNDIHDNTDDGSTGPFDPEKFYTDTKLVEMGYFPGPSTIRDAVRKHGLDPGTRYGRNNIKSGRALNIFDNAHRRQRPTSPAE